MANEKYFLSTHLGLKKVEREVTVEEYCKAERMAGFMPKMSSDDPRYLKTPATGGFSSGSSLSGRIERS